MSDITSTEAQIPSMQSRADRRFSLPNNEVARSRIVKLHEVYKTVAPEHPEIIGMTLFGSMVKGRAKETSDIDAYLFVDANQAELTDEDWEWAKEDYGKQQRPPKLIDLAARHHYRPIFTEPMKSVGMTDEQLEHIKVRAISSRMIKEELAKSVQYETRVLAHDQSLAEYKKSEEEYYRLKKNTPWSEWDKLGEPPTRPSSPEYQPLDRTNSAMFHLAMGNKIDSYRFVILDYLKQNGAAGEMVWKDIASSLWFFEKGKEKTEDTGKMPRTLDAAIKYYKLPVEQRAGQISAK